jgi:hypothetical protein
MNTFDKFKKKGEENYISQFLESKGKGTCIDSMPLGFCRTYSYYQLAYSDDPDAIYLFKRHRPAIVNELITKVNNKQQLSFLRKNASVAYKEYRRRNSRCTKEDVNICLLTTWGPDVCSLALENMLDRNLNTKAYDVVTSPACANAISKTLKRSFTSEDALLATITGGLDDLGTVGLESDRKIENILGIGAKLFSLSIKTSIYKSCLQRCN